MIEPITSLGYVGSSSCLQKVLQLKPVLHLGQNDIQYHVFMFLDIYLLLVCSFLIKNSEQVTGGMTTK